jgi:hypothetical protein
MEQREEEEGVAPDLDGLCRAIPHCASKRFAMPYRSARQISDSGAHVSMSAGRAPRWHPWRGRVVLP